MTICKGKRYIKATCDKCVEKPYCKPTEKPKFKELQKLLNGALLKRITALEERNTEQPRATHNARLEKLESEQKVMDGGLNVHKERIYELQDDVEKLVTENEARHQSFSISFSKLLDRVEKLESLVGTLQQHSEDIFNLGKDIKSLDTAQGFLNKDRCELADRVKELETALYRLEIHVGVIGSNASVACECSNKQAAAITKLQKELEYAKIRLARCQDSVASLDPLGSVTVKRGRPKKSS
jgi:chromosome segregation ATPase